MALTKSQKQKILEDLKEKIKEQKAMVFVEISGLKAKELLDLRKKLKERDSQISVIKKTLFKIVLKEFNQILAEKIAELKGQLTTIFGFGDEIWPAKIAYEFSKDHKNLKILGGYFEKEFRVTEDIIALAKLPPKEELLARLIGGISGPISNFVNILEGNLRSLVYIFSVIKK